MVYSTLYSPVLRSHKWLNGALGHITVVLNSLERAEGR